MKRIDITGSDSSGLRARRCRPSSDRKHPILWHDYLKPLGNAAQTPHPSCQTGNIRRENPTLSAGRHGFRRSGRRRAWNNLRCALVRLCGPCQFARLASEIARQRVIPGLLPASLQRCVCWVHALSGAALHKYNAFDKFRSHTWSPAVHRISVSEAERDFSSLIHQVCTQGVSVELERDNKVVARITPAGPSSPLQVRDLNKFLESLPRLGDDAESFAEDQQSIRREVPAETNPWD